jgi:hypothetical protein
MALYQVIRMYLKRPPDEPISRFRRQMHAGHGGMSLGSRKADED